MFAALVAGCMDIPLTNTSKAAAAMTKPLQEVYERYVDSKHFYIEPIVIACGNRNGVVKTADDYRIVVRYDHALRVIAFEVVPFWAHPRDYSAPKVPIPQ